jgi:hypothetical protein
MYRPGGRQLLVLGTPQKIRTATSVNNSRDQEWVVSDKVQYKLNRGIMETPNNCVCLLCIDLLDAFVSFLVTDSGTSCGRLLF